MRTDRLERKMAKIKDKKKTLNIDAKAFITSIVVIFVLMVATYILTMVIPGGEYPRITDENGNEMIDTSGIFTYVEGGIPFWKWLLSPVLVLGASGNSAVIAVIVFLFVLGGVFSALDRCGLIRYMLDKLTARYCGARYKLMPVLIFFFMALGSLVGSFEECVPLVPIVVALSVNLGWDVVTGLGMSLLAVGCGFAAGVCNPFTIGIAQQIAGLPMFSGVWLRLILFVLIYVLLTLFVYLHAKKVEKPIADITAVTEFVRDEKMEKALRYFCIVFGLGILTILSSTVVAVLQKYSLIIVAVTFLVAGVLSVSIVGMNVLEMGKTALQGMATILPAVLLILMAASIKYTMEEANILDTLLHRVVGAAETMPKWVVILFIYLIVLLMDFFVSSGSAKAFMLIPIIVPLAQVFGLSTQLCIVAFAFGDGFSNVFYPTNTVLLISLGLVGVSYGEWVKYSWKFQIGSIILTSLILLFGLAVGY